MHGMQLVIQERFGGNWHNWLDQRKHGVSVIANLLLSVRVHPQREEMKNVVQVTFPVPFCIDADRQPDPRELSRYPPLEQLFVVTVVLFGIVQVRENLLRRHLINRLGAALTIRTTLLANVLNGGSIKAIRYDRITSGVLVDISRAMPNPLARHKNGHDMVKLKLDHFERRCMAMARQVADKAAIFLHGFCSLPV